MESLRTHILASVQRACSTPYEGKLTAAWQAGKGQSLPPPADDPKKRVAARERMNPAQIEEVRNRIAQGQTATAIARAMGVDAQRIYAMKARMKRPAAAMERTPTPATVRSSGEPQRLHVLTWHDRMSAWQFDGDPWPKCKPKKLRKPGNQMTRKDMRRELRGGARVLPAEINPCPQNDGGASGFDVDVESKWRAACTQ